MKYDDFLACLADCATKNREIAADDDAICHGMWKNGKPAMDELMAFRRGILFGDITNKDFWVKKKEYPWLYKTLAHQRWERARIREEEEAAAQKEEGEKKWRRRQLHSVAQQKKCQSTRAAMAASIGDM